MNTIEGKPSSSCENTVEQEIKKIDLEKRVLIFREKVLKHELDESELKRKFGQLNPEKSKLEQQEEQLKCDRRNLEYKTEQLKLEKKKHKQNFEQFKREENKLKRKIAKLEYEKSSLKQKTEQFELEKRELYDEWFKIHRIINIPQIKYDDQKIENLEERQTLKNILINMREFYLHLIYNQADEEKALKYVIKDLLQQISLSTYTTLFTNLIDILTEYPFNVAQNKAIKLVHEVVDEFKNEVCGTTYKLFNCSFFKD